MPDSVVTRRVDGSTVLLNTATGRYFRLDAVGTTAWTLLISSPSIQAAYEALLSEYDVQPDELRRDVEALIDSLSARGLIEVHRA